MERFPIKYLWLPLVLLLLFDNPISIAQVENQYYFSFNQYYPYCDDHATPVQGYVFENSNGNSITTSGISGFFTSQGFPLSRYKMVLKFGTGPEVSTSYFPYEQGAGIRNEFFFINQSYYTCELKGTNVGKIDDPVYIGSLIIEPLVDLNSTINYTAFAYNPFSKPVGTAYLRPILQYSSNSNEWNDVLLAPLNPAGGALPISPATFLKAQDLYKNLRFRIIKRIGNVNYSLSYGNISPVCSFYDTVTVKISSGGNIQCLNSSFPLKGGFKHFPDASPNAQLEVKLASEPETAWRTISKTLTDSSILYFADVCNDNNWLGKEIYLRPYKTFSGRKICGQSINFMFLPEMKVSFTAVSPKCHQGTDGQIRIDFPGLTNIDKKPVPIWITIYKYDKYPLADTSAFYKPVYLDGEVYYFNSGLTIQTSITQNYYILKSGTYNNLPYLLGAGIYKIKAGFADSSLCPKEFQFRLNDPSELVSSLAATYSWGKPPLTYQVRTGENAASAKFTITGGTSPYSYKQFGQSFPISPGDSTGYINLLPGSNIISFFDSHGCTSTNTLLIRKPPDIAIQNIATLPVQCHQSNTGDHANGQVNFMLNGGVPPFKAVLYRAGSPVKTIYNLSANEINQMTGSSIIMNSQYQLYITDTTVNTSAPYIKKSSLFSVGQPDQIIPALEIIPSLCSNTKAGLNISVTGGTGEIEIALGTSGFSSENSFIVDPGINYSIVIHDDNLCSITCSAEIPPAPTSLSCIINIVVPTCSAASNGLIELTPSGGSPFEGNIYQIFLPEYSTIQEKTNRLSQSGLQSGQIAFEIQDRFGCLLKDSVYLPVSSNPPAILSAVTTDESCPGRVNGSVTFTINPGARPAPPYSFKMYDSVHVPIVETLTNMANLRKFGLPAGKYYLEFSDHDNCSDNKYAEIKLHPSQLQVPDPVPQNVRCPGTSTGAVSLTASGGISANDSYNFTLYDAQKNVLMVWYGNPLFTNNLSDGNYTIRVQDDSACSATRQFGIYSTEGIEYTSNTGFIKDKGMPQGNAAFEIRKGNGSFSYRLLSDVPRPTDSVLFTGNTTRMICFDSLYAGDYILSVMDTAGCLYNGSPWLKIPFKIVEPEFPLEIRFIDILPVTCHGLSNARFRLSATGGWGTEYRYSIDSSNFSSNESFNNLPAGIFKCYAVDTAGALAATTLFIPEPDSLVTTLDTIISAACFDDPFGQIRLNISGGTLPYAVSADSIKWCEGTTLDSVPKGLNLVYLKDHNLCTGKLQAWMPSPPEIKILNQSLSNSSCLGSDGSIRVGISGGTPAYKWSWSCDSILLSGDSLLKNLSSGEYLLRITDSHACARQFSFFVSDSSSLRVAEFTSTSVSCYGFSDGTARVKPDSGQSPYSYRWSGIPGNNVIRGLSAGPSILQITDAMGCSLFYPFTTGSPDSLRITDLLLKDASCKGVKDGEINVRPTGGTAPYRYLWSNGADHPSLKNLTSGEYLLTLLDSHNCSLLESFTIRDTRLINPGLGPDILLCAGNNYLIDGGLFSLYKWKNDSALLGEDRYLCVSQAGKYFLEVQDEEGCTGADTLTLALSQTSFDASLLASTTVELGDTLILLETSWPLPDSVHWELGRAEILAATPWSRLVSFNDTGTVELKITGFFGDCLDVDRKLIRVIPNLPEKEIQMKENLIREFKAFPNPVVQNLTVRLELAEQTKAMLRLVRIADGVLLQVQQVQGPGRFELPLNVQGLTSGFYSLQLVTGEVQKNITIAVK
jgi:hypothetical protein